MGSHGRAGSLHGVEEFGVVEVDVVVRYRGRAWCLARLGGLAVPKDSLVGPGSVFSSGCDEMYDADTGAHTVANQ